MDPQQRLRGRSGGLDVYGDPDTTSIALYLDGWATRAGPDNRREALAYIATRLAQMAEDYDDADLQRCMAAVAYRADPATLAPRRLRARTGGDLMQEFCAKKP